MGKVSLTLCSLLGQPFEVLGRWPTPPSSPATRTSGCDCCSFRRPWGPRPWDLHPDLKPPPTWTPHLTWLKVGFPDLAGSGRLWLVLVMFCPQLPCLQQVGVETLYQIWRQCEASSHHKIWNWNDPFRELWWLLTILPDDNSPHFFSASRTVFKLKKINIPKAFWDHFVTTHFKFSFSFLASGFQQYENTCRLHFLTTHSFCNQLQPTSFSYNSSEIILNKINIPHLINKCNGLFLFLILFPSLQQYRPWPFFHSSITPGQILIIPISSQLFSNSLPSFQSPPTYPVNHSQISTASSTPANASPSPLWPCSGP